MRKILLIIILFACALSMQAQKLRLSDIPQEVRMGLQNTQINMRLCLRGSNESVNQRSRSLLGKMNTSLIF